MKEPGLLIPGAQERVPPFGALRAFESAARQLSFKKAAEELHVTPSAISQQVRMLEDQLNVPLFRRLTRALELTPEGVAMVPKVRDGLESLSAAMTLVRKPLHVDGPLTVAAPPSFATRWLLPRLQRFATQHPEIDLRLTSSLEMIDGRADPYAIFLSARSAFRRSTLRSLMSGWMLAAPSSVAFSTSQSMRSLAGMPTAR